MVGTVKSIQDRGFGFISVVGGKDVFFHCKSLDHSLPFDEQLTGRRVEFGTKQTDKGLQAINVRAAE